MTDSQVLENCAIAIRDIHGSSIPKIAIILGSGLGAFADRVQTVTTIKYADIPGFPQSTVAGHAGQLLIGDIEGVPIFCMQGRMHLYEGYSPQELAIPIRTMKLLGIETLVLTNAAGGLQRERPAGSLMIIEDHINFTGQNPLAGQNDERFGERFFDMSEAYDRDLQKLLLDASSREQIDVYKGTYLQVIGPNFETPAEVKMFAKLGAHAVGMSTVPECLVARHCGIRVAGLSLISNLAAGLSDTLLSHEEVFDEAKKAEENICRLLISFLKSIK